MPSNNEDFVQLNVRLPRKVYDEFVHFVKVECGYTYGTRPGFAQFFKDWYRDLYKITMTELGEKVLDPGSPMNLAAEKAKSEEDS